MSNSEDEEILKYQLFVIRLGELLDDGKIDEAERLFEETDVRGGVANSLWEILPVILSHINHANEINARRLFETCKRLLRVLANKCNPKEMLLLLVGRIEETHDEATFRSLLEPLGVCLIRAGPARAIDWCVRSIKNYILNLPRPENKKPPSNEREDDIDGDTTIARLIHDYDAILAFLEPLVVSSALPWVEETNLRNHLLCLHLSMFGGPFCYLQHDSEIVNTTNFQCSMLEKSLKQMSLLSGNFFKYHGIMDDRSRGRKKRDVEEEENMEGSTATKILRSEYNVTDLAWANYYYSVLCTQTGLNNIPQVYDFRYLMQGIFHAANVFLGQPEYVSVRKGLMIVEAVVARINVHSVGQEMLEIPVHRHLFDSLARVMVYCDSDEDRKYALKLFHVYIDIFDYKARYLVIINIYETANHSGIFSLLTSITKKSIIHCLEIGENYFFGDRLERLMKRICRLPNGVSSDLVEISDEVIAALNLVRFLTIRDRKNETGIWRIVDNLEKDYLLPLREGIEIARAHWMIKVKDLNERRKNNEETGMKSIDREITISVGGQTLPMMPVSEKIKFCRQAISALDVMESILVRVNECIGENFGRKHCHADQLCS